MIYTQYQRNWRYLTAILTRRLARRVGIQINQHINQTINNLVITVLALGLMISPITPLLAQLILVGPTTGDLTICKYNDNQTLGVYEPGIDVPMAWHMDVLALSSDAQGQGWSTGTAPDTDPTNPGCVTLAGLPYGDYRVTEQTQAGWMATYLAGSDKQIVTLDSDNETVIFLNDEVFQCSTGAVSVINAGFENPVVTEGNWNIYPSGTTDLGWSVQWAGSYSGAPEIANLELQNSGLYTPSEGNQYAELDTDWDGPGGGVSNEQASVSIYQNIDVIPYATYQLHFELSARPGYGEDQNNVHIQFGNIDDTVSIDGTSNTNTSWATYDWPMENDGSTTQTLKFTDLGTPDSFGMLIDNIRLELTSCPTPSTGRVTVIKQVDNLEYDGYEYDDFNLFVGSEPVTHNTAEDFASGTYQISETGPEGYAAVYTDDCDQNGLLTVAAGQSYTCTITNTYTEVPTGTIEVCKYEDTDGNGEIDMPELSLLERVRSFFIKVAHAVITANPLSGWTINITDGDDYNDSKVTGEDGCVQFTDLPYATYTITETSQTGWIQTYPGDGSIVIDLDASYNWAYFLNHRADPDLGSITVHKYNDLNGNGERDSGEPMLPGWRIILAANHFQYEGPDPITDSEGKFTFNNLRAGDYDICEIMQDGWENTYPGNEPFDWGDGMYVTCFEQVVLGEGDDLDVYFGNYQEPLMCTGSGTYTTNQDFDKGTLINVEHNPDNQLQLSEAVSAFNFIWVAVSTKGTVVKINTDTGAIVGEYRTAPSSHGNGDPSRTTVDKDGSVWLSNRSDVYDGRGSVIHIGLLENNQCEDRNGNGIIDTSTAQNDIKTWANASGDRSVATAEDECIIHYVQVPNASGTRHVSVDTNNNVWVAGYYSRNFDLIKGGGPGVLGSGNIIRSEPSVGYGGYGGLIDKNGVIWSAANLLRWDTANPLTGLNGGNWTGYNHSSYGLCIDNQGNVFNTEYGQWVRKFSPAGALMSTFGHGTSYAQGCVVDKNDDLWVAGSLSGNTVDHLKNDGTYIGSVTVGSGPTGVAVDANGKIWATNYYSGNVSRIDPTAGPIGADSVTPVGAVDFTSVSLGGNPYNYSDMTGSTLSGKASSGTWTVAYDGSVAGFPWKNITWTSDVPSGAGLIVTVATSSDGVNFGAPQTITSGQDLASLTARYLKVVVIFERSAEGQSPILYDLDINRDCGESEPEDLCPNLPGVQSAVPAGYNLVEGVCVEQSSGGGGGGGGIMCSIDLTTIGVEIVGGENSAEVTLNFVYPIYIDSLAVSNDPTFSGASFQPAVATMPWTLTGDTGRRTVYVRYHHVNGCIADKTASVGGPTPAVLGVQTGPMPQVLGATTCSEYLLKYLRMSRVNDPVEVKKLQVFLNEHMSANLPVTGFYGPLTFAAVKRFQLVYKNEVLKPWVAHGLPSEDIPTGYVYKTTKRWINLLKCPSLNLLVPALP